MSQPPAGNPTAQTRITCVGCEPSLILPAVNEACADITPERESV